MHFPLPCAIKRGGGYSKCDIVTSSYSKEFKEQQKTPWLVTNDISSPSNRTLDVVQFLQKKAKQTAGKFKEAVVKSYQLFKKKEGQSPGKCIIAFEIIVYRLDIHKIVKKQLLKEMVGMNYKWPIVPSLTDGRNRCKVDYNNHLTIVHIGARSSSS